MYEQGFWNLFPIQIMDPVSEQSSQKKKNVAKKYLKNCSLSLATRELQIKSNIEISLFPSQKSKEQKIVHN